MRFDDFVCDRNVSCVSLVLRKIEYRKRKFFLNMRHSTITRRIFKISTLCIGFVHTAIDSLITLITRVLTKKDTISDDV